MALDVEANETNETRSYNVEVANILILKAHDQVSDNF